MASVPPHNNPSKKAAPRSLAGAGSQSGRNTGQTVKFARRTSSGRYISLSREDMDLSGELSSGDYMNYTVQIPRTPDHQPMDASGEAASVAHKAEEQYVSNSLFTGGFNSVTRAHLMDKVIDSEVTHPQMAGAKGSRCHMPACDGKVMRDQRGEDIDPCECRFKICSDCYMDAQDSGNCPGCKEPYKIGDYDDDVPNFSQGPPALSAPGGGKGDMRMSVMNSNKSLQLRGQGVDFDHNRWLFETQGTYGYGNAYWPKDGMHHDDDDGGMIGDGFPETVDNS